MIDIIESMSPGLTGDMGEANKSSADTFKTVEKSGKFIAALQFILPLAYGFLGFVMLQGMATIIDGQQKLSSQLTEQATTSSFPQPPPRKTDLPSSPLAPPHPQPLSPKGARGDKEHEK